MAQYTPMRNREVITTEVGMRGSRALLAFIILASPVAGSAVEDLKRVSYKEMIRLNRVNANKITTGMTRDEVMRIMRNIQSHVRDGPIDNPWKVEINGDIEVLHYITSGHPPFTPILAYQATPIVLREGRVVGMGRGVLKQMEASGPPASEKSSDSIEKSIEERLNTLKKLYDNGVIDRESYETQRTRILESI